MTTPHARAYTFREVQTMRQWWLLLIIGAIALLQWIGFFEQIVRGNPWGNNPGPDWLIVLFWIIFGIGFPIGWAYMRLIVEVRTDHLRIVYVPFLRRTIPYAAIASATAITYRPIRDFGGWGIRIWFGRQRIAYSTSGNRGVELVLTDGRQIVLGSQQPERLATAINAQLG